MLNAILMFVRHILFVITLKSHGTIFQEVMFTINHGKTRKQWEKAACADAIKLFGTDEMLPWSKNFNSAVYED